MVAKYGMCENLGTVSYLTDGEVFIGRDYQNTKSYSEKVAGTIDDEVKGLVDRAYADCEAILRRDADKLNQVVEFLLAHETMSGSQFVDCMEGREIGQSEKNILFSGFEEEESRSTAEVEELSEADAQTQAEE